MKKIIRRRQRKWHFCHVLIILSVLIALLLLVGCEDEGTTFPPPNEKPIPMDEAPNWSPDGRWIAYTHISIDPYDSIYPTGIYIIDTSGQNRRLVIAGPAYNPDWSPDGKRIAFNGGEIFTITPNGDSLYQVTNVGNAFFPSWSPDGNKIVFDTPYQDPRGANAIWIINADGTMLHDISTHGTGEWRDPDWSPDGTKILHLRYLKDVFGEEVFVMDTSGLKPLRFTTNSNNDRSPSWSGDSKYIIWTKYLSGGNTESWIMNTDGTNQRFLVGGYYPCFSPNSKQIAFSRLTLMKDIITLWKINIDGTNAQQLTY